MNLLQKITFVFIFCLSFTALNAQTTCPLEIFTTEINCGTFSFNIQDSLDQEVFWSVNEVFQNHTGENFTFQTDNPGDYIICSSYETIDCPNGVLACDTVSVSSDCFDACTLEVTVDEVDCRTVTFLTSNQVDLFWTVNGEPMIDEPINFIDHVAPIPGTYEICGTTESTACPTPEVFCYTLIVTEDCFPDDCYFTYDVTEYNCQSYNISATNDRLLSWTVNQEPYGQGIQNSFLFTPDTPGAYSICGALEASMGCPNGRTTCFQIVVDEECFATDDCILDIETTEIDCNTFSFAIQDSLDAPFFWSVNWESQNISSDVFTFVAEEAGDYVICGGYETPSCPAGVVVCDTLSISADCFVDPCAFDIQVNEFSCNSFSLIASEDYPLYWTINQEPHPFGNGVSGIDFVVDEPGTYEICGILETPDCPSGEINCQTIVVDEACFGMNNCTLDIASSQINCNTFSFTVQDSIDASFFWSVNGVSQNQNEAYYNFEASEVGDYIICGGYETNDCPNGVIVCDTVFVSSDCFESTDDCSFEIEVAEYSCQSFYLYTTDTSEVFWTLNGQTYNSFPSYGIDFYAEQPGNYELCGTYESNDCPNGVAVCQTILVDEACFGDCPLGVAVNYIDCKTFNFTVLDSINFVDWTINTITQSTNENMLTFEAVTAGEYTICASYVSPDCPNGNIICETISVSPDCFGDPVDTTACEFVFEIFQSECDSIYFYSPSQIELDWTINNEVIASGSGFNFNPSEAGEYVICASLETPDCPNGNTICEAISISPDCFEIVDDCAFDIIVNENSCQSFHLIASEPHDLYWTINGQTFNSFPSSEIEFYAEQPGTYEICSSFQSNDCPNGEIVCHTITVTEDCFDDPVDTTACEFVFEIFQNECDSIYFYSPNQMELDWTVNNQFMSFGSGFNFNPSEAGEYIICASLETPDCPNGNTICEAISISPDCFEIVDDCALEFEIVEDCNIFNFFTVDSLNEQINWSVNNDASTLGFGNSYTFEAESAGSYTVCAAYESIQCSSVEICETFIVSEDCFDNPVDTTACDFVFEISQNECDSIYFYSPNQMELDWTVNDQFISFGNDLTFVPTEAGDYTICASIETPDCPNGNTICEVISISPDCFVDPCEFNIEQQQYSCNSFSYTSNIELKWTVNGFFAYNATSIDFEPSAPGTFVICGMNENPDCPIVDMICDTIIINEDCFEDGCEFEMDMVTYSCSSYTFTSQDENYVAWYVNQELILTSISMDFEPTEAGTYSLCAFYETPDCPSGNMICRTVIIQDDCFETTSNKSLKDDELKAVLAPNPSHDYFTIQFEEAFEIQYEIIDTHGKVISKGQKGIDSIHNFDIQSLANGVYFINVKTKDQVFNKTFVKQ